MKIKKIIHWFRQDLRLSDNPSWHAAVNGGIVLPIYVFDKINSHIKPLGASSGCWLHYSLISLTKSLNNNLLIKVGDPLQVIINIANKYSIDEVYWNRCYEPWQIKRDTLLKAQLKKQGIIVKTYNGSLLWEPWEIAKKDGGNYKVFTPFYQKGCLQIMPPRRPLFAPNKPQFLSYQESAITVDELKLLPNKSWVNTMMIHWQVGELAARKRLINFIKNLLDDYADGRNFPAKNKISRLSPHLHWGELSPNQVWYAIKKLPQDENTGCFLSEIAWREFSYNLLYYYPYLPYKNLQKKFDAFSWRKNKKLLTAWQRGITGYPLVDAGMRELWQTGFMHNRVRMVVASFLVKNLRIHWQEGEQWFWDCLVDADLANNSASWQWVAGCGADAAPFFRIFNPTTQGKKFDANGEYTRYYVPELKNMPDKYLFSPQDAPDEVLQKAGVKLGVTYPKPIVDLSYSRERALDAYEKIKT